MTENRSTTPNGFRHNRESFDKFYRAAVGVDDTGAALSDPKDVSTYSHMFSVWETLSVIKAGMEAAGYQSVADRPKLIEAI